MALDGSASLIQPHTEVTVVVDNELVAPIVADDEDFAKGDDETEEPKQKEERTVLQRYTKTMTYADLLSYQQKPQRYHVHLTFETCIDMKENIDFIPVVYQERSKAQSHHLLIFDIFKREFVEMTSVSPPAHMRSNVRKSETGFVNYTLTRTSDPYEQSLNIFQMYEISDEMGKPQNIKYQVCT